MSKEHPAPEEHSPVGSTNWETNQLPHQRHAHQAKGLLLFLPISGLIVAPYEAHPSSWSCVVVSVVFASQKNQASYPRGGYNLDISNRVIETALEVDSLFYDPRSDRGYMILHPEFAAGFDEIINQRKVRP